MRGRKPYPLAIVAHDRTLLQQVARSETLPGYQVRPARAVLAIAAGQRTKAVASHLECHTAGVTADYFEGCHGWWRPRPTPARASWLDQAELLIHAFGDRYLKRSSWQNREEFIRHVADSWYEYNGRHAHPFEWTWTNQKMRQWFKRHRG